MTAPRSAGLAAAVMTAVVLLSGCSGDEQKRSVELDVPAQSSSPTPGTTPGQKIPEEPPASGLVRGLDPASTPDEQLVTDTWFRYWTELTRMYTEATLDRSLFGGLARGQAYEGPVGYVERLQSSGNHNEGGSIASVEEVRVTGDRAVVTGCQRTRMAEVTAQGAPAEFPAPFVRTRETLKRTSAGWVVVVHDALSKPDKCTYR